MTVKELINRDEIQRIQDEFCAVVGVYAYCVDEEGEMLTAPTGSADQIRTARAYFESPQARMLWERVEGDSLEDLAIEELPDGKGKIAAFSVKVKGQAVFYWLVLDLNEEEHCKYFTFEMAVDLLRDGSYILLHNKYDCFSAAMENVQTKQDSMEIQRNLKTIEAMAQIVQLLDSDEPIESIMSQWLSVVCEYLNLDTAQIFNVYDETKKMDVVCEWLRPDMVSFFDKTNGVEAYEFLKSDKPIILSTDSLMDEDFKDILELGMKAVMILPLIRQDTNAGMVLSLNHRKEHRFDMEEIKFAADAVKLLQSVLTRRIQKNSLAGSYASLEAILDNVGSCIYVVDLKTGEALFANRKLRSTFVTELRDGSFSQLLEAELEGSKEGRSQEIYYPQRDRWYDRAYKSITWVDGRKVMLYSFYDITDKKLYQSKIEQQAYTDFLTGLYNRMCCERDLAVQIDEAKKNDAIGALLYLDLDDFKHINDGLGHQYGDVLLKAISHALQRIQGIQDTCYRMGGDEFVIIVPYIYYEDLDRILEDIKQIFSKPWFLKDADYYCTMSMGIVTFPNLGDSVQDLVKKADIAMYEAKKGGKNRLSRYSDHFGSMSDRRLDMEKNMRDATVGGYEEFEVYYQPIIDVQSENKGCAGAEALIRWNSAKLGFIPPAEFIPLAEYLGLINPIGNYVLREACYRCKDWNDNGYPHYKVNVNLSVVQLLQPDIVDIVAKTLKESGLKPNNLTLEVTESLAINDMERMKEILSGIKSLGVKLALDDFGTGYSSLNHIREIPFDIIKVDQSFVKDLATDGYAKSFVRMVSELAQAIGVSICVEGIETYSQYEVLEDMSIKYIQGYYFDKPMPREAFESKYVRTDKQGE